MSSPAAPRQVARAPASQPVFPDEILEEIFLRLDAAADIARASAACTTFRRVVSARRFRRRFRSLHPPPILGFLECHAPGAFHPAEPPHGSAPAARALAQAADFSLSFIDAPDSWRVCDARDGRVLLYRQVNTTAASADLSVCDPLHRRYVQLPPIPDDLAAATGSQGFHGADPFLDAATDKEDLSFRVICAVQCRHKLVIFHFSSVTGKWHVVTFNRTRPLNDLMAACPGMFVRHYAHGCFHWTFSGMKCLFIFNARQMKFSAVEHPFSSFSDPGAHVIVELGRGRLGLVNLCHDNLVDYTLELYSMTLRNNGNDTEVWQHDKTIPLPKMEMNCHWNILDAAEGYLLLQATPWEYAHILVNEKRTSETHCFTLDLKTFLFERWCMSNHFISIAPLYAGFPPPLSLPSI